MDAIDLLPDMYTVHIECLYPSGNESTSFTLLRVNENEFPPTFDADDVTVRISEDGSVSMLVTQVIANDDDLGFYGEIIYSIPTPGIEATFEIHPNLGQITLASGLDFEQRSSYQFDVTASNRPSEAGNVMSASILVMINVTNIDDTSPVFDMPNYMLELPENNDQDINFLNVSCTDVDTENSRIRYGFTGEGHSPFQLNSVTGQLTVPTEGLDYETTTFYSFVIACFDGSPMNSSDSALVDISVLPLNDAPPIVSQQLIVTQLPLNELTPVGTVIASTLINTTGVRYTAHDDDDGPDGNVTFTFAANNDPFVMDFFSVDLITGEVAIEHQLDVDSNTSLTAEFSAILNHHLAGIRITVCDVFPPPPSTVCPNIVVLVFIQPSNEFSPEFSQDEYSVNVSESAAFNAHVISVTCTDRDLFVGQFSAIDFVNASQNVINNFVIDHTSGEIAVRNNLDYEDIQTFGFYLRCNDTGGREDQALVVVNILPVNDNFPRFDQPAYQFNVSRSTPANQRFLVGAVSATDADIGLGGELFYSAQPNPYSPSPPLMVPYF